MVRIQGSTVIARPVEEVFDFVADERHEPAYNPRMRRAVKVTPGPIGAGTQFSATMANRGRPMHLDTELTEYDRPSRLRSTTRMPGAEVHGGLTFTPEEGGTRMAWDWELEPRGLGRLLTPMIGRVGSRQEQEIWSGLKRHLERPNGAEPALAVVEPRRPVATHVMTLADGRNLAWLEVGAPDGAPVFAFHGTPGSRLQLASADGPAREAGVRLVLPDRPGYGLSTHQSRRRLATWADDVTQLADHLGLPRFAVVGISGGGPHAAACARFLPDRVTVAAIVSGVAPLAEPGSEAGMLSSDVRLARLARRSPALTRPVFAAMATAERHWPERVLDMMTRELGPTDAAVLQRPEVRADFLADLRASSRTTGAALTAEYALFTRDWGFRLEDITVPVHLWHGDADRDVPFEHARRQAEAIPGAVLHECPGEGHLLVVDHLEEILRLVATSD